MFGYRLFNLITRPNAISTSAHVITTFCLLLRTGWQWVASLHTQLSVNMCLGFVFVVWPTTRISAVVHTTPSRPSQLCGEERTISLPWFISIPLRNFLRQWWFIPPESQEQLKGPRRKGPFSLRGGDSFYLFASLQQRSDSVFTLRSTWRAPYPTAGSEPNAHGMNGMPVEGQTEASTGELCVEQQVKRPDDCDLHSTARLLGTPCSWKTMVRDVCLEVPRDTAERQSWGWKVTTEFTAQKY